MLRSYVNLRIVQAMGKARLQYVLLGNATRPCAGAERSLLVFVVVWQHWGVREGFLEVVRLGLTYELHYIQVSAQRTGEAGPLPHEKEILLQEFKVFFKKDAQ